jgi:hypothetical protein
LAVDRLQSGSIRISFSSYNDQIRVYVIASYDGTTWPDTFTGSTGSTTITSEGVRDSFCKLAHNIRFGLSSITTKHQFNFSIAELFGGIVPKKCAVWVVTNSTSGLHSTGTDHTYYDVPVFEDVT